MQFIDCLEEAKGTSPGTTIRPNIADYSNVCEFMDASSTAVMLRLCATAEPMDVCLLTFEGDTSRGCHVGGVELLGSVVDAASASTIRHEFTESANRFQHERGDHDGRVIHCVFWDAAHCELMASCSITW